MKQNKTVRQGVLILAILFVVYTVVVFLIPFTKNWVFILSYAFTVLAMAAQLYVFRQAFWKGPGVRSKFYGFPIARLGVLYLVIQIVLGIVFMALSALIPVKVSIIVFLILAALAAVGMITADIVREEIVRQEVTLKTDVTLMRGLQSKIRTLSAQCEGPDAAEALRVFSEAMQYSDPVSDGSLTGIEADLSALVDELQAAVVEGDNSCIIPLCKQATAVLTERNRLCKLNKQ